MFPFHYNDLVLTCNQIQRSLNPPQPFVSPADTTDQTIVLSTPLSQNVDLNWNIYFYVMAIT